MSTDPKTTGKLGIVLTHFRTDAITTRNLQSFRDWNPDAVIVTVSGGEAFPGGYSILDLPGHSERWKQLAGRSDLQAQAGDLLIYAWYENRREQCERWVIVEWDAYCAMPVEEFFAHVWEFDVAGPTVQWQNRDPDWYWFSKLHTLPAELQPFGMGIMPLCFVLVRDEALAEICSQVPWGQLGEGNAELRFGTLAFAAGFVPVATPLAGWNISWNPLTEGTPVHSGMWHPVKWLVPPLAVTETSVAQPPSSASCPPLHHRPH
jgi:hypothetical protein